MNHLATNKLVDIFQKKRQKMNPMIEDIFQNNEYQIKSKFDFNNFDGIRKQKKICLKFYFNNHKPIIVSIDHVFIVLDYELVARNIKSWRCFRN